MPLISVIIPVYNVEKYLEECVDSVINQTYKNLEIILINDGSTDLSPKICDEYAKKDSRIKVIHQENCGIAQTRNVGLQAFCGEYFLSVDSDDALDCDTISFLYEKLIENEVDIACCSFYFYSVDSCSPALDYNKEVVLDNQQAYFEVINSKFTYPAIWGKLYKRNVLNSIVFPKDSYYEDNYVIGEILLNAKSIFISTLPKVKYRQRKSSIMHKTFNEKTMQLITVYKHCLDVAKKHYPSSIYLCNFRYLNSIFIVAQNIINCKAENTIYFEEVIKEIKNNFWAILKQPDFSLKRKLSIFILLLNKKQYIKIFNKNKNEEQIDNCFE